MKGGWLRTVRKVFLIGIGYKPLDERACEILAEAGAIFASDRLMSVFRNYAEYGSVKDNIRVINNVDETINCIRDELRSGKPGNIVLLASGDPLFFGIGRRAVDEFGKEAVEIIPDLSSMQAAFARIKEPWDNALLMSVHGGPDPARRRRLAYGMEDIPQLLRRMQKLAVLTDRVNSPARIAAEILRGDIHGQVRMYVCERLGYPEERVVEGTPAEIAEGKFADPNVVIVIASTPAAENGGSGAPVFGLREDEITHARGLITKDEVRAVTIHRLRLPQGGVLWDIGAGSGSISIEAARLCPGIRVYAIEKAEDQIIAIRENIERFKTANIETIAGAAPERLIGLPAPDRVFIGGSGGRLHEIMQIVDREMKRGIVVLNATTLETLNEAVAAFGLAGFTTGVAEVGVSRSKEIAGKRHLSAMNPVFIVNGERR